MGEEAMRAHGVAFHMEADDCEANARTKLSVNLGKRRAVGLNKVLERVAAQARARDIEEVTDVKLVMSGAGKSARLYATAVACASRVYAQAATIPVGAPFTAGLRATTRFDVHRLTEDDWGDLNLAQVGARPSTAIQDAARVEQIKSVLLAPATYDPPPDIQKACPFWPTYAVAFNATDGRRLWLLIAQPCQSARYLEQSGDWRRTQTLNLTPAALGRLVGLLQ